MFEKLTTAGVAATVALLLATTPAIAGDKSKKKPYPQAEQSQPTATPATPPVNDAVPATNGTTAPTTAEPLPTPRSTDDATAPGEAAPGDPVTTPAPPPTPM
jgi:hypothetical protein